VAHHQPGEVAGKEADAFLAKKAAYLEACARAPKVMDCTRRLGRRRRLIDIEHPTSPSADIAVQRARTHRRPRSRSASGAPTRRSSCGRKILAREYRALAQGRPGKKWRVAPLTCADAGF